MAAITPLIGPGMLVKVNGSILKCAAFERPRTATRLPIPTSGMVANADGEWEVPNTTGLITRELILRGPYDNAAAFHNAPYNIRPGVTVTVQVGLVSTLLTPAINYKVERTTDRQDVERLGEWEAVLVPKTDDTDGYYTVAG